MANLSRYINKRKTEISLVKDLIEALNIEIDLNKKIKKRFIGNLFIISSDRRTLERYANLFKVETINRTDEEIRQQIISKMNGTGVVNKNFIQALSNSFELGELDIEENKEEDYTITISFIDIMGKPTAEEAFRESLMEVLPAHIAVNFFHLYMTWNQFDMYNKTFDEWDSLNQTWEQIETYRSNIEIEFDKYISLKKENKISRNITYVIK